MVWSTSQLAELTGTTVNTVRHYHSLGLLDEPLRLSNGYKQYGVPHLVRLLQVKRLRELGIPLSKIPDAVAGTTDSGALLSELHAELEASILRLEATRDEIAALLGHGAPLDTPAGFVPIAEGMTPTDRSLISIFGQVYDDDAMRDIREMFEDGQRRHQALDASFEALPADAPESARAALIDELVAAMREYLDRYAWLLDATGLSQGRELAESALGESMRALYNEAQIDVLVRALVRAALESTEGAQT